MRRHTRANPFVRRRLSKLIEDLKSEAPRKWPRRFNLAWVILHDELNLAEQPAQSVLILLPQLHMRAPRQLIGGSKIFVEFQTRNKLHKAFERIAKCAERAPAALRRHLDVAIIPLIQNGHIDLEVIETIFDAAVEVFSEYSRQEAAKTALSVLTYQAPGGDRYTTVKNDFPGLSAKERVKSEKCSHNSGIASKKRRTTASDVFAALAGALQSEQSAKLNSQIHILIVHDCLGLYALDGRRRLTVRAVVAGAEVDPVLTSPTFLATRQAGKQPAEHTAHVGFRG